MIKIDRSFLHIDTIAALVRTLTRSAWFSADSSAVSCDAARNEFDSNNLQNSRLLYIVCSNCMYLVWMNPMQSGELLFHQCLDKLVHCSMCCILLGLLRLVMCNICLLFVFWSRFFCYFYKKDCDAKMKMMRWKENATIFLTIELTYRMPKEGWKWIIVGIKVLSIFVTSQIYHLQK